MANIIAILFSFFIRLNHKFLNNRDLHMNSNRYYQWLNYKSSVLLSYKFIVALLIMAVGVQQSFAQSVEPMIFELEPIGARSSESLRINNPNSGPMTLEIVPLKIVLDEFGNETNIIAEDDFLIYPPQTIVQPDSTQLVKVKYIGDPSIEISQAYRISVNQLPVDLQTGSSGVSVLTKFLTMVNVIPKKSRPELKIEGITAQQDNRWLVTVKNSGNRFGALSNTSWQLESTVDSSKSKNISADEVGTFIVQTLVPPKSTLRLSVPAVEGFDPASTKITMKKEG